MQLGKGDISYGKHKLQNLYLFPAKRKAIHLVF